MTTKPTPTIRRVRTHYDAAVAEALRLVERRARAILRRHGNLDEFLMSMGCAFFTVKGSQENLNLMDRAYFKPLRDVIYEFDDYLKLTGAPMRLTADGPVVTDW